MRELGRGMGVLPGAAVPAQGHYAASTQDPRYNNAGFKLQFCLKTSDIYKQSQTKHSLYVLYAAISQPAGFTFLSPAVGQVLCKALASGAHLHPASPRVPEIS